MSVWQKFTTLLVNLVNVHASKAFWKSGSFQCFVMSHDVASGAYITPCNKIDKSLVVYRFSNVT